MPFSTAVIVVPHPVECAACWTLDAEIDGAAVHATHTAFILLEDGEFCVGGYVVAVEVQLEANPASGWRDIHIVCLVMDLEVPEAVMGKDFNVMGTVLMETDEFEIHGVIRIDVPVCTIMISDIFIGAIIVIQGNRMNNTIIFYLVQD
jgi:hypothetical protein